MISNEQLGLPFFEIDFWVWDPMLFCRQESYAVIPAYNVEHAKVILRFRYGKDVTITKIAILD